MDVFLWVLIGLGAGALIGVLIPDTHSRTLSEIGWNRIRQIAAGGVGAGLGGFGLVLVNPVMRKDGLTTAAAALAGALCVSAATALAAARRRGANVHTTPFAPAVPVSGLTDAGMPAYDSAREALVAGLTEDAAAHDAGRYSEVGRAFPTIRDAVYRQGLPASGRLHVALRFWRAWIRARDRRWARDDPSDTIDRAAWPGLARVMALDLALDRDSADATIASRFAASSTATDGAVLTTADAGSRLGPSS